MDVLRCFCDVVGLRGRFVDILTRLPPTTQTTHSFEEMPNAHILQLQTTQNHRDPAGERER